MTRRLPLEDSMGWKRSSIGAIALMSWIAMGMESFASGYLPDHFGTRRARRLPPCVTHRAFRD